VFLFAAVERDPLVVFERLCIIAFKLCGGGPFETRLLSKVRVDVILSAKFTVTIYIAVVVAVGVSFVVVFVDTFVVDRSLFALVE